jgi:hypothetical protein
VIIPTAKPVNRNDHFFSDTIFAREGRKNTVATPNRIALDMMKRRWWHVATRLCPSSGQWSEPG